MHAYLTLLNKKQHQWKEAIDRCAAAAYRSPPSRNENTRIHKSCGYGGCKSRRERERERLMDGPIDPNEIRLVNGTRQPDIVV